MNYKVLQPPEGMDIKDLIRLHGTDKSYGETASSSSNVYLPSEYDRKQIIKWIEHFTGLKVDKKFMNIGMEFVSMKKREEIITRQTIQALEKIDLEPGVRKELIEGAKKAAQKYSYGFFTRSGTNGYLVKESIEELFENLSSYMSIKTDSLQVKKRKDEFTLHAYIHELLHEIMESSLLLGDYRLKNMVEFAMIKSEWAKVKDKDPLKAKALNHKLNEINEKTETFATYEEAITHPLSCKVLGKLGHSYAATIFFEAEKNTDPSFVRGIAFLQAIERKTGKNPIVYTINHPPTKLEHIDNPDKYLKDREEGRV